MPRFYFDCHDGNELIRDEIGVDVSDLRHAELEAAKGLTDLAAEVVANGDCKAIAVSVRDAADRPVLKLRLAVEVVRPESVKLRSSERGTVAAIGSPARGSGGGGLRQGL